MGFKQTFYKYERQARGSGKSKMSLLSKGPVTDFINGITSYSLKPLYIGIFFGFLSIIISLLLIILLKRKFHSVYSLLH